MEQALRDYYICRTCINYLGFPSSNDPSSSSSSAPATCADDGMSTTTTTTTTSDRNDSNFRSKDDTPMVCVVCMGLWQDHGMVGLQKAIEDACGPYGGIGTNRFATRPYHAPTLSIAGDIMIRYLWFASKNDHKRHMVSYDDRPVTTSTTTNVKKKPAKPFSVYSHDLKQHLHTVIRKIVGPNDSTKGEWIHDDCEGGNNTRDAAVEEEEQGYLSLHVLCIPPKDMKPTLGPSYGGVGPTTRKRKRQRQRPYVTQGGDPRMNLETRLQIPSSTTSEGGDDVGYQWISQSTVESMTSTYPSEPIDSKSMEYHVAAFRRPIFLYGYYTKSRRDVSQTPFAVQRDVQQPSSTRQESSTPTVTDDVDEGEGIETINNNPTCIDNEKDTTVTVLGVTSVEEQICGPVVALLGVSTCNNLSVMNGRNGNDNPNGRAGSNGRNSVIYGMCKFHASGREDMDVRMLVRTDSLTIRGRPFCIQIVDALRPVTSTDQLRTIVHTINHTITTSDDDDNKNNNTTSDGGAVMDKVNADDFVASNVTWYGRNPFGVGIAPDSFYPVSSKIFSGLQEDTESKVKHYGCLCWSKDELPPPSSSSSSSQDDDYTLTIFRTNNNNDHGGVTFPLTIQQRTPIRVLHRRANTVRERQVLHMKAYRIDDHHFRLELSTQAGTYVKEFVSGDLGRTSPSISSILGCKTNLLALDCEGIDISISPSNPPSY